MGWFVSLTGDNNNNSRTRIGGLGLIEVRLKSDKTAERERGGGRI